MKYILIFLISLYQAIISPAVRVLLGVNSVCRFEVSCSEYAKRSIKSSGLIKGSFLSVKRLLSCQPFGKINQ